MVKVGIISCSANLLNVEEVIIFFVVLKFGKSLIGIQCSFLVYIIAQTCFFNQCQ